MVWGFIGFFIMVSVWGIVNLLVASTGLGSDTRPDLPTFNQKGGTTQNAQPASGLPSASSLGCRAVGAAACPAGTSCDSAGNCKKP